MQFIASLSKRYAPSLLPHIQFLLKPPNPNSTSPNNSIDTDWQSALEFFNWAEKTHNFTLPTTLYNQIIDDLGKSFEFDLALKLIHNLKPPNHTTFHILFKRYAAAHMIQEAIHCYNNCLDEFNLKDEISFSNLIEALCEYSHVSEAEALCRDNYPGNTRLYNIILTGWLKMGWWSKCHECWENMGMQRDLYSYLIYMDVMCKSGRPREIVKLYNEMKKNGIKLDDVAYNMVIRVVALTEGVDMAMRIYGEMLVKGCKPDAVIYNMLVKLLCQTRRLRDAYTMFGKMMQKGCVVDVCTCHCVFSFCNKPQEMLKMFGKVVASGVRPRMDTYVMLLRKFGRWGLLGPVFVVWNRMVEHGYSPDAFAYNILIDALIHKGLLDMARKYEEEMLAQGISDERRKELRTKPLVVLNDVK